MGNISNIWRMRMKGYHSLNHKRNVGLFLLLCILFLILIIVCLITGYNPLCNIDTNSTLMIDRCFY